jgi:hypothetical protein
MKYIHALIFCALVALSAKAQTIDYNFIKDLASKPDQAAIASLIVAGYTPTKNSEYRFIADGKIKAYTAYVKADTLNGQKVSYWAFQARGKKAYKPIFNAIKKGAEVKSGNHFGKRRTEYKSPDGLFYYPFEDSMFDGLYWIYASKASLLDE